MKLYIQDDEVLLDYSDVNFEDVNDQTASDYRDFMRSCNCGWEPTLKPKVKRMAYKPWSALTPYGNAAKFRSLIGNCYYTAIYYKTMEISDEVKKFLDKIEEECKQLEEIETAKENERKAAEQWKEKCKYGCGRCINKLRSGDDFLCASSGDILPERNVPKDYGKVHYLFNYEAFPTDNCPLNVNNKMEEAI